jgi:predicted regulator of Ras-like GTPase activity (Roadblock/LC7/MglB family)
MSFSDELQGMSREVRGCRAAWVMDLDGIPVASQISETSGPNVETLLVELAGPVRQAMQALRNVEAGNLQELILSSDRGCLLIRMLKDNHFVALFLGPGAATGQARYVLRRHTLSLLREMS